MDASDIIKKKQNVCLYNAYYNPVVYQSTVFSTINIVSSISSGSTSYASTVNTVNTYVCQPQIISYNLYNDIINGKFDSGDALVSKLEWENTTSSIEYFYSTSGTGDISSITSTFVLRGPGPLICPPVQIYQGLQTYSDSCPDCEGGTIIYCNYLDSGYY